MNLEQLFQMQKALDERIVAENNITHDRFDNLILCLLDEVGECAKETRCFKDWSKKGPNDKVKVICEICDGSGDFNWPHSCECLLEGRPAEAYEKCVECDGTGGLGYKNPILEEYVDGLHFVLSHGLLVNIDPACYQDWSWFLLKEYEKWKNHLKKESLTRQFIEVYKVITDFSQSRCLYPKMFIHYLVLGNVLGFTHEEIEQAYLEKNKVNHQRQDDGY